MDKLLCPYCRMNGQGDIPAVALAPQTSEDGLQLVPGAGQYWIYVPVCGMHLSDWWAGTYIPEAELPPIIPIVPGAQVPDTCEEK